jgi:hypothetical protein
MDAQTNTTDNNSIELTIPHALDTCVARLEEGYSISYLDHNIRHTNEFRTLQLNEIDDDCTEFRTVYSVKKGKKARSVYITGDLLQEDTQTTQVTAQVEFPVRSIGCMALFFSPLLIMGGFSEVLPLVIAIYVIVLLISYVAIFNEYKSTGPVALEALSNILEGKANKPHNHTN